MQKYEMTADRWLVVDYLHQTGKFDGVLKSDELWEVYCLGDGFGELPPEMLMEINGGWDWSHIRDSTSEAMTRMADWLRTHGYTEDGPAVAPAPRP